MLNPVVIFEVLSDSTEAYDPGAKASHYRHIPALKEYVLSHVCFRPANARRLWDGCIRMHRPLP